MAWVYILQCNDGSYYTGYAMDLEKRWAEHQTGVGCKYTRGRRPLCLVYSEVCEDKSAAMKREYAIKRMTRRQKEKLIQAADSSKSLFMGDNI